MPFYGVHPATGGASDYPLIVMFMDVNGIRQELKEFCNRYSREGFHVVLPDLYYRFGKAISFDSRVPVHLRPEPEVNLILDLLSKLTDEIVAADALRLVDYLARHKLACPGGVGAVGYCMGGRHVIRAMTWHPEVFVAGSAHFPTYAVSDDERAPYLLLDRASGPLYVCVGGEDRLIPQEQIEKLRDRVADLPAPSAVITHAGAGHGYSFPLRPGVYDEKAADEDWKNSIALFECLKRA